MTKTTATPTTTDRLIETVLGSPAGLTLGELARATGLRCDELRLAIESLGGTMLDSTLTKREGRTSKVRIYTPGNGLRMAREADLTLLGEEADRDTLLASNKTDLFGACACLGIAVRRKSTKTKLADAILTFRAEHYLYCPTEGCGEPVDRKDELCGICLDARSPRVSSTRSSGDTRKRIRKPDVDTSALPGTTFADAEKIAADASSGRAAQRGIACLLAERLPAGDTAVPAETLRTLLRKFGVLSAPNFTINMKKDKFIAVRDGRTILGWNLPA